jgi:hypothetical protein
VSAAGTMGAFRERFAAAGTSLRARNYRVYFIGQSVAVVGTFMQTLATAF